MRFPTTVDKEIPNWMSIKAHESANNLLQDGGTNWGKLFWIWFLKEQEQKPEG